MAVLDAGVGAEGAPLLLQFQRWPALMTSSIRAGTEVLFGRVGLMTGSTAYRLRG